MNRSRLVALLLLLIMFARMTHAATLLSPVVDEQSHISRGLSVLRTGDLRLQIAHPIGLNVWQALPLVFDASINLPLDNESWFNAAWDRFGEQFLWRINDNPDGIVFRSRVMVILLTLILGAVVYRWAAEMYDSRAALLAIVLYTLDPNMLAHGMLATTDLGVTLFIFAATYALWRGFARPDQRHWFILAGILAGLAFLSKYSGLILGPIFFAFFLSALFQHYLRKTLSSRFQSLFSSYLLLALVSFAVVLTLYLFRIDLYVSELGYLLSETQTHPSFFLDELSFEGWWYYFPVTFLLKTPLPLLLLTAVAILRSIRHRTWAVERILIVPSLLYFAFIIVVGFNVGYRHMLPIVPFLVVYVSALCESQAQSRPATRSSTTRTLNSLFSARVVGAALVLWLGVSSFAAHPNYIAYFNEAAPYPRHDLLVDSNLDWGQGLKQLRRYLAAASIPRVRLSYFGTADPKAYDIAFDPLPRWPVEKNVDFVPVNPAPGVYAISASNLQGVLLDEPSAFDWFRRRTPDAVVGQSILVYDVQVDPDPPQAVGLCREPWTPINDEEIAPLFDRERLRVVRFDCDKTWWWPNVPVWYVVPSDAIYRGTGFIEYTRTRRDGSLAYSVFRGAPPEQIARRVLDMPAHFDGGLTMLGTSWAGSPTRGEVLEVESAWRVDVPPKVPVSIFAHILDANGGFIVGSDGFGVPLELLETGDMIARKHQFHIPADTPTGEYVVSIGFYRLDTLERYTATIGGVIVGDQVLTESFSITE